MYISLNRIPVIFVKCKNFSPCRLGVCFLSLNGDIGVDRTPLEDALPFLESLGQLIAPELHDELSDIAAKTKEQVGASVPVANLQL